MAIAINKKRTNKSKSASRSRRQLRIRKRISGTAVRPRLVVNRSARHVFVQVVDDTIGQTVASASTMEADLRAFDGDKTAKAKRVGELVGERAKAAGVESVVFDRGGHRYAGAGGGGRPRPRGRASRRTTATSRASSVAAAATAARATSAAVATT